VALVLRRWAVVVVSGPDDTEPRSRFEACCCDSGRRWRPTTWGWSRPAASWLSSRLSARCVVW